MLYGRRLDQALEQVDGSRYALVHAVAKRARQITLWLTADPAELRAESAPPPAPGELMSRDPVALAEMEILDGEVRVRWDPEGRADEALLPEPGLLDTDPLLIESFGADEEELEGDEDIDVGVAPALAQVLDGESVVLERDDDEVLVVDDDEDDEDGAGDAGDELSLPDGDDDLVEVPLDSVEEEESTEDEEE
jgi:DNA-directed RNA polymerase omega subunit